MAKHSHINTIVTELKANGARITKPRLKVLEYLCSQSKPVTVKDLEKKFPSINIVTLYRIMDYFVEHNIVHTLTYDPTEKYFEIADPYHQHHHHTICRKCNTVRDVSCKLELPTMTDFIPDMHVVTIYGYCTSCK